MRVRAQQGHSRAVAACIDDDVLLVLSHHTIQMIRKNHSHFPILRIHDFNHDTIDPDPATSTSKRKRREKEQGKSGTRRSLAPCSSPMTGHGERHGSLPLHKMKRHQSSPTMRHRRPFSPPPRAQRVGKGGEGGWGVRRRGTSGSARDARALAHTYSHT